MKKKSHIQMLFIKAMASIMNNTKRTKFLKCLNIFAEFGNNCYYCSRKIPEEPYLIKIHDNVVVAANVNFITHDIINDMLSKKMDILPGQEFSEYYMGTIEIFDNVAIGSDTTILYGTQIGPNAVVAAGSVVTKDVPEGTVVGGNPARVIGRLEDLIAKRKTMKDRPIDRDSIDEIMGFYWKDN